MKKEHAKPRRPGVVYTRNGVVDGTRRIRSTPRSEPERIVLWLEL